MTSCKYCSKTLTFSEEYVSEKSGKKIPLSAQTGQPHRCQESLNMWHREHPLKCRQCGEEIFFDDKMTSESGKLIPLATSTGNAHDCPKSKFYTRSRY